MSIYAHNALSQRVFKAESLFSCAAAMDLGKKLLADCGEGEARSSRLVGPANPELLQQSLEPQPRDAKKVGWNCVHSEDDSLLGE